MSTLDLSRPEAAIGATGPTDIARPWALTVEQLAYLILGALALLAHLWALGDHALHHDETLHASYSWYLLVGRGYIHDPLLHGPLLYYIGAFLYFLFGDNDFTARLGPALAGTALTLSPYLIRREIGRPAALIAACYLLISPVALYVGRFFRHDIYSVLCEVLVFAAIVRYVATRRPAWLLAGTAAFGLMLVNQETSYLFLLIMAAPLLAAFLWQVYRPGLAIVAALGVLVALLVFVLPGEARVDGAHNASRDATTGEIVVERPGLLGWGPLETEDNAYALRVRNRADDTGGRGLFENIGGYLADLWLFFRHPAILIAMGLCLGALAALIYLIWRQPSADGLTPWAAALERGAPAAEIASSLGGGRRWLAALLLLLSIYALFFTAFFTNIIGLFSGVAGSLLYWLAQHNVQRGSQPGHYYFFLLSVYEPLLLIFGALGLALLARDVRIRYREKQFRSEEGEERAESARPDAIPYSQFSILLLAWWAVAALGIYTWAGEKMPWLTLHMSVPLTLFAAWAAQRIIWTRHRADEVAALDGQPSALSAVRAPWVIYGSLFAAIVGLGFVLMTAVVSFGEEAAVRISPWMVAAAALALVAMLTIGAGLRWGWGHAAALLAVCTGLAIGLYTARSAVRLAYINSDVPVEAMVYTQTSPDVMRVVRRLEEASRRRGGGLQIPVQYDNETVWSWYLRDFSAAQRTSGPLVTAPDDSVMAVLLLQENFTGGSQQLLDGFVVQRYPLRWWFPEDQVYRLNPGWRERPLEEVSLLAQLLRAPFDREVGERWWRFLMFRDPGAPLGSTDFVVAVRPELASQIGVGLGGDLAGKAGP